jgi:hypothetical protein
VERKRQWPVFTLFTAEEEEEEEVAVVHGDGGGGSRVNQPGPTS